MVGIGGGLGISFLRDMRAGETPPAVPRRPRAARIATDETEPASAFPVLAEFVPSDARVADSLADHSSTGLAAMRKVHAAIRAAHHKSVGATVLVIGPRQGDDTRSLVLHLAGLAAATERVLLIDADVERRTIGALCADQPEAGLVDVAIGSKILAGAVTQDLRSKITVLPLVSPKSRRRGAINEDDLKAAFEQTRRFDLVIVVAPNYDKDPSARFFAALVDHIVLIQERGAAGRRALDALIATLQIDAGKVRGTVLVEANQD
jgi:succinoglycan biosynthesis transport protein ExoP